jgi:hypothetical protein
MIAAPFGETVVLKSRTVTGQDADGNDVYGTTAATLEGVPVWPRNSSELVQGENLTIVGLSALLPPGTDASAIDVVTVYGGDYEIDGEPGRYRSPFTNTEPGVLVNLTRISG